MSAPLVAYIEDHTECSCLIEFINELEKRYNM